MPGTNLTQLEAKQRAERIHVNDYRIDINLCLDAKHFLTETTVEFAGLQPGCETFIDLVADSVEEIVLNGSSLDPAKHYQDSRILLPNLQEDNTLVVRSTQAYTNTGEGLHRFVDPEDGKVYLYTQFEVPDARRVFAVFDQPDLKARFQFTVTAPADWLIISNQPTPQAEDAGLAGADCANCAPGSPIARWHFAPTPIMSSYITALICGPYVGKTSSLQSASGREIPLGVYCRASLAQYLDADYILEKTEQGFAFFEKEFEYPYPFEKYDQVFVPEFNMGAMENIGAVTHTEAYVFRGKVSDATRERRVITVIHELAHMWFGDLVTMKWWNDLWLNESFAEFMSTLATAEGTEWEECWTTFASSEKSWAYQQDQLPSTHPVVAEISDLNDILTNFDGITYAKGASVLKALVSYVGREAFMRAIHEYFTEFAYKNTQFEDLLKHLQAHTEKDLSLWAAKWLETSGVNTLRAEFSEDASGKLCNFRVVQEGLTRPHELAIGVWRSREGRLERAALVECEIAGESTEIAALEGVERPDLIVFNDGDLTYAKIRFDGRSLATIRAQLATIEDSLTRAVIWGGLWDATRDAEFDPREFVEIALAHLHAETASTTLQTVLRQVQTALTTMLPHSERAARLTQAATSLQLLFEQAPAGSDRQFQFFRTFASLAQSEEQIAVLERALSGETTWEGLEIDQDMRWLILCALARKNRRTRAQLEQELARDNTAAGKQYFLQACASINTLEAKEEAWANVFENPQVANLAVRYTAAGFFQTLDLEHIEPFVSRYFDSLLTIWSERNYAIFEELVNGFFPLQLTSESLRERTEEWLRSHADAPAPVLRSLNESLSYLDRALKVQKRFTS